MKKHKHEQIEVITKYFKADKPPKVKTVFCTECDQSFPELKKALQKRWNDYFEMSGMSPVAFWNPEIKWAEESNYWTIQEFEAKGLTNSHPKKEEDNE